MNSKLRMDATAFRQFTLKPCTKLMTSLPWSMACCSSANATADPKRSLGWIRFVLADFEGFLEGLDVGFACPPGQVSGEAAARPLGQIRSPGLNDLGRVHGRTAPERPCQIGDSPCRFGWARHRRSREPTDRRHGGGGWSRGREFCVHVAIAVRWCQAVSVVWDSRSSVLLSTIGQPASSIELKYGYPAHTPEHIATRRRRTLQGNDRVAPDAHPARITSDTRPARITSDAGPARITSDTRPARITSDARPARITSDTRPARIASDTRPARIASDTRPARIASDTRPARARVCEHDVSGTD